MVKYILLAFLLMVPISFAFEQIKIECTGSMYPTLNCTNKIYINYTNYIKLNDIVIFDNPDLINNSVKYAVVHRVIGIRRVNNKTFYLTKGDFNNYNDFISFGWYIPKKDIYAKVISVK